MRPLEGEDNITEGIYKAMEHADEDGNASVVVSWEIMFNKILKTLKLQSK